MKSTRLPGKPLIDLCGKSLIQRTFEQCIKAMPSEKVFVATDDQRIESHCRELGINTVMTTSECLTGTDRIAEVVQTISAEYYINVQGDEPLMNPEDITEVMKAIIQYPEEVINGYTPIDHIEQYSSLSVPKLVFRPDGRLLYMSRSKIPGNKTGKFRKSWRQVCIYAFPKRALLDFAAEGAKTSLEEQEDLEILRFLEMGYEVRMIELSNKSIAVDTPADVDKVIKKLKTFEKN